MGAIREKWIDNAKGISMICVIIGHVSSGFTGFWNFQFVYGFHLVMFFLLSGLTFKKKPLTIEYMNSKFSRLMTPYFYTCAAIMIMDAWNSYFLNHDCSITTISYLFGKDLVRSFFGSGSITSFGALELGTRIGAIWFFPALLFASLLFQGLLQNIAGNWELGICAFFVAITGHITARFIWMPFSIQAGMFAVFFLWIGYEIRRTNLFSKIKWHHYLTAQIIFLMGIYYHYANIGFVAADLSDLIFSVFVGLSGCLIVYWISIHMRKGTLIAWIGENSMCILCVHLFVLETMGFYVRWILDSIGLTGNIRVWGMIVLEILFPVMCTALITATKKIRKHTAMNFTKSTKNSSGGGTGRNAPIDISKGIFILLMLVGHFPIDSTLRRIIYSCHMVAFVFWSGYFYKKDQNVVKVLKHLIRTFLIPYGTLIVAILVLHRQSWSKEYLTEIIKRYLLGMSFSKKIFSDISSVGPVYFILMLFSIRIIFTYIDMIINKDLYKLLCAIALSFVGIKLGEYGYWLPWSIDIALYALIFYLLGVYFRKYNLLSKIKIIHIIYFPLVSMWVYMIYISGMEIAIRNYGEYGIVVIGSLCGVLVLYKLAVYIDYTFPAVSKVLTCAGRSSMIILIVHTLFGNSIIDLVSLRFGRNYMPLMILSISIQMTLAMMAGSFYSLLKGNIVFYPLAAEGKAKEESSIIPARNESTEKQ